MWARRCGVPPKWPSRVKVTLMSLGTLAIGVAVYQLLSGDDVAYLDLNNPSSNDVLCLNRWPLRDENPLNVLRGEQWEEWVSYRFNEVDFIERHMCVVPELSGTKCYDVDIPIGSVGRKLGRPLGVGDTLSYDVLDTYAWLFLLLAGWLWVQVVVHDLSLLATANKDYVLDLSGIREEFRCLEYVAGLIGCSSLTECCWTGCKTKAGRLVGTICMLLWAPVALVWSVVIFLGVAVPVVSLIFLIYPARMSRFGVFLAALACAIYGLILCIHNLVYLWVPHTRAEFAVTWVAGDSRPQCICGCVYPLNAKIVWQFALVGGITTAKSIFLAMRCLKGLRRRNWANMLSVTFPVPVNAYAVEWRSPASVPDKYKKAIKFRVEEEGHPLQPVQGELAFDPFAMMDEQPDSKHTLVNLKPTKAKSSSTRGRKLEGPKAATMELKEERTEHIGCCGFPCLTGGKKRIFEDSDLDPEGDSRADRLERDESGVVSSSQLRPMSTLLSLESVGSDVENSQAVVLAAQKLARALQEVPDGAQRNLAAQALQDLVAAAQGHPPSPSSTLPATPGACAPAELLRPRSPELSRAQSGGSNLERISEERFSEESSSLIAAPQAHDAGTEHIFGEGVGPLGLEVSWHRDRPPSVSVIVPGGEAEPRGICPGDVLVELNGQSTLGRRRSELLPVLGRRPLRLRVVGQGVAGVAAASAEPTSGGGGGPARSGPRAQAGPQAQGACLAGCGRSLSPCQGALRATSFGRTLE